MRDPRDPRDDELEPPGADEESQDSPDELQSVESQRVLLRGERPALSHEIAQRWDPSRLVRTVASGAGTGAPLDAMTRARYERRFGVDLGGVRVYTGEFAERVTAHHSAEAVTVGGTGMIFMSGTPDRSPATAAGRSLLAHELTHVAQSQRGVYRSAPGERPPLATEEHEAEAEAVEAEEEQAESAGVAGSEQDPEKAALALLEVVTARVLDLVYEDERVDALRNGDARTRP